MTISQYTNSAPRNASQTNGIPDFTEYIIHAESLLDSKKRDEIEPLSTQLKSLYVVLQFNSTKLYASMA